MDRIELDEELGYCRDCLNVFPRAELDYCICDDFLGEGERTVVTREGVKRVKDARFHCSDCLKFKHIHAGQAFI